MGCVNSPQSHPNQPQKKRVYGPLNNKRKTDVSTDNTGGSRQTRDPIIKLSDNKLSIQEISRQKISVEVTIEGYERQLDEKYKRFQFKQRQLEEFIDPWNEARFTQISNEMAKIKYEIEDLEKKRKNKLAAKQQLQHAETIQSYLKDFDINYRKIHQYIQEQKKKNIISAHYQKKCDDIINSQPQPRQVVEARRIREEALKRRKL